MRYLSLFSGIEAATVAWHPLGWQCVAVSEIEPFPCALLAHHYPTVPNLGDVTKITERDIQALGQIDLVVFGSPCQDLSVAGKRRGFEGERSGLFFTAINIIEWARKHCGCRWALWENVPGAFTSNNGGDFAAVVGLLAGLDDPTVPPKGWGTEGLVEWAVLDAQWFEVAQRRRRVFALADFGDWTGRPPILLEPEGLRGDSAPCRETGQVVAALTRNGVGTCGADDNQAQAGHIRPVVGARMVAFGEYAQDETASCMKARDYKDATDLVAYGIPGNWIGRAPEHGGNATEPMLDVAPCQTVSDRHAVAYGFNSNAMSDQIRLTAELSETLTCSQYSAVTAFSAKDYGADATVELSPTLRAGNSHTANQNSGNWMAIQQEMQVRRLTPVECERLQGFPDNYTLIPDWYECPCGCSFMELLGKYGCPNCGGEKPAKLKSTSDGARYKALGNSMAVPVMRWIGQGIDAVALFQ